MKLYKVITGLVMMLVAAAVPATTLKLSPELDLLVLDGRRISGSLLKGADGLELERGEHQLLFRLEKNLNPLAHQRDTWRSAPQIVTFITNSRSVVIQFPAIGTPHDGRAFDKKPQFRLVDEQGNEIASKRDRLLQPINGDAEQVMIQYNLTGKIASVPRFAQSGQRSALAGPPAAEMADSHSAAERMLHLWYQQVDSATRQRFVMLLKALHTS
ncbi:DUF2057 domain-containing protein [Erwinia sp. E602]|uniref:YccT family protein n=1 Tax=unclassified Erwinia TaxID=2622719 RepID=UPI0006FF4EC6|nr:MULTISPECIES: DUF2057 family protein [unclassified Erwinia]KQN56792.1 hypothetical protein ASF13_06660 [Erwinia sp. Leaf53]PLV62146.1 hypothetical protein NV64_06660 [Erwinia sp. B116]QUG76421.1 DUF2057 domain-containing protein [Erwinia sp. E602]